MSGKPNQKHHHHLVCIDCGKVIDYHNFIDKETELVGMMEQELSRQYDFKITAHQFHFYGYCDKCRERNIPSGTDNAVKSDKRK